MNRKKLFSILKYLLGFSLGIGLLYLALSGIDFDEVKGYFEKANYAWVALALAIAILSHWFRAVRWKLLLKAAGYESNAVNLFASIMVGYMVNQAIPRAGEVSRVTLTSRTEKIPLSAGFGTLFTDRIFDLVVLGLMVLGVVLAQFDKISIIMGKAFSSGDEGSSSGILKWILIATPVVGLALFFLLRKRLQELSLYGKIEKFIREVWLAVRSVTKMKEKGLFIFYTLGIWVCYVLMTYLVFFSLDETAGMGFGFALTVFIMGGIGMVFPSPGGIGSYHFAVITTFSAYAAFLGLTVENAELLGTIIAFIIHTSQLIMMIVVGFLCYLYLIPRLKLPMEEEQQESGSTGNNPAASTASGDLVS